MASNDESKTLNRLGFPRDARQDLIVGHLRQKSTALAREAMLTGQERPARKVEDLLTTICVVPRPMNDTDTEKMRNYYWQLEVISGQDCYIRSLLSQTLPRGYLESLRTSFNEEDLPFDKALEMDFSSVRQLIIRVKETRNRINRQSRENLKGVSMIPNVYAAIKVLSLFPSQYCKNNVDYTSEGFHLDKVEALLRNIFMDKSKSQIQAMQARIVPANYTTRQAQMEDEPKKKGGECFYCEGRYNPNGKTHRKADCPKMKKDRSIGLVRTSIFVKGKRVDVPPPKSMGVSHEKGEKKGI
ncbi:hypothetical protein PHMEG_00030697 [Phytophthora megakarya]|uniref:Uncharacterized protein n=1 Tax=Phytophthora megakarya TaxID=4795 RepID=A0A225V020_9STRA|nr:hypothetical protein PHMEG_00030697 [Phytophthora megakarya]